MKRLERRLIGFDRSTSDEPEPSCDLSRLVRIVEGEFVFCEHPGRCDYQVSDGVRRYCIYGYNGVFKKGWK